MKECEGSWERSSSCRERKGEVSPSLTAPNLKRMQPSIETAGHSTVSLTVIAWLERRCRINAGGDGHIPRG